MQLPDLQKKLKEAEKELIKQLKRRGIYKQIESLLEHDEYERSMNEFRSQAYDIFQSFTPS